MLKEENIDFHLNLMGMFFSKSYETDIIKCINKFNLNHRVSFLGTKTGDQKWDIYNNNDILCFPSYVPSESFGYSKKTKSLKKFIERKFFRIIESAAFCFADISVVSNPIDFSHVKKQYYVRNLKINPSFVDTSVFYRKKNNDIIEDERLMFVGRLEEIKNIINTIDAVLHSGYSIDIFGDGNLKSEIIKKYESHIKNKTVRLMGRIPNSQLDVARFGDDRAVG